jgi:hypothetical protein
MNMLEITKPRGGIELVEVLAHEWGATDDADDRAYFNWWWNGVKKTNSGDWKGPSFSVKRVLRGGKRPQHSLTGWDESAQVLIERQRQIDELVGASAGDAHRRV